MLCQPYLIVFACFKFSINNIIFYSPGISGIGCGNKLSEPSGSKVTLFPWYQLFIDKVYIFVIWPDYRFALQLFL